MQVEYCFKLPKSRLKEVRDGLFPPHTNKPDVDNMVKFTLDACQGALFADDKNIIKTSGSKKFGKVAYTKITMSRVHGDGWVFA